MKRPWVYIAGPMTLGDTLGHVRDAMEMFSVLWDWGFHPVCPHWSILQQLSHPMTHAQWIEYDLPIVAKCDAVYRLPGESKGADAEVAAAQRLGIPVFCLPSRLRDYFRDRITGGQSDLAS